MFNGTIRLRDADLLDDDHRKPLKSLVLGGRAIKFKKSLLPCNTIKHWDHSMLFSFNLIKNNMLFSKISELFTENDIINFSVRKTNDELTVSIVISTVKNNGDKAQFPPLLVKGTASEIDQEIYAILKQPMSKINGSKQLSILGNESLEKAIDKELAPEKNEKATSDKRTVAASAKPKEEKKEVPKKVAVKTDEKKATEEPKKPVTKKESKYDIPEEILDHIKAIKEQGIFKEKFKDLGKVQLASQKTSMLLEKYKDSTELKDLQKEIRAVTHKILMDDDDDDATPETKDDDIVIESDDNEEPIDDEESESIDDNDDTQTDDDF